MTTLNFQHLRYFWLTARDGTLTGASAKLRLSPSTVSTQIKTLESMLGRQLFDRLGRRLVLTEYGEVVKQYADDIFSLGEEMVDAVRSVSGVRHAYRLRVGVSNNLPKWVAHRLLSPALCIESFPVHLVCREDHTARLVADLAVFHLDLVLSDTPVRLSGNVDANCVLVGESGVSLMGVPALAARHLADFPRSLHEAPLLLPDADSAMRRLLDDWFGRAGLRPRIVAEFGDSALLKVFGQSGAGLFPVPSMVADEVAAQYRVVKVGELEGVSERFYAITPTARRMNPAVRAVLGEAAQALDSLV